MNLRTMSTFARRYMEGRLDLLHTAFQNLALRLRESLATGCRAILCKIALGTSALAALCWCGGPLGAVLGGIAVTVFSLTFLADGMRNLAGGLACAASC